MEIRRIIIMFADGKHKVGKLEDFLIEFNRRHAESLPELTKDDEVTDDEELDVEAPKKGIEVGVDELDEHWQKVNAEAKAEWMAIFALIPDSLEEVPDGWNSTGTAGD